MALENYRDTSPSSGAINAGFQFEFYCAHCGKKWQSDFRPYRLGQITGFLSRFAFLLGTSAATAAKATGGASDYSVRSSREKALTDAQAQAESRYVQCGSCKAYVCNGCFELDANACKRCAEKISTSAVTHGAVAAASGGHACPNCRTPASGGRFCAECGFDMASTHKSCPGCGVLAERKARFCGDCGYSF